MSNHMMPTAHAVVAGFINGVASRTLTAPFDRLRALVATGRETGPVNAARTVLRQQGAVGLWAGNAANILQAGPENAVTFTLN